MRTIMIIFLGICLFNHKCKGVEALDDSFILALMWAESEHDENAIGDDGVALGILQIWPDTIKEYNRLTGANLAHTDAFWVPTAVHVCRVVLEHHGAHVERQLGRSLSRRELGMMWNGGPTGWKGHKPLVHRHWKRLAEGLRMEGITPIDCWDIHGNFSIDLFQRGVVEHLPPLN
jgi:hypothetical protein